MTAKKTTAKKATTKKQTKPDKAQLVHIALQLAVDLGWEHVTLNDVSSDAGITLAELHDHFEDKGDILVAYGRMVDRKVLENLGSMDPSLSHRDALFEILMERFDVVNAHRDAVISILSTFKMDPKQAVISMPHLCKSMTWMLEAAGISTQGFLGAVRVAALSGVYLNVLRSWKRDESEDLSKTMAALDKDLVRLEQLAQTFGV